MKRRSSATVHISAVNLACPFCEEIIEAPDGSQIWDEQAFITAAKATYRVTCSGCQQTVELPLNPVGKTVK